MNHNGSRLALPSDIAAARPMNISGESHEGPLATAIGIIQPKPDGPHVITLGGAYRDEQLAASIVGGMLAHSAGESTDQLIATAFELADEIIAVVRRRRATKKE